jgi:amino acid permease
MAASGMLPARLAYKSRHGSPPLCIALSAVGMLLCFASSFMEVRPQNPDIMCVRRINSASSPLHR